MYPIQHLVFGIIFSLILFTFFPQIGIFGISLIILSTFFIDADHYLFYVWKRKDLSLRNAYRWFTNWTEKREAISNLNMGNYRRIIVIFHGFEFWAFLSIFAIFNNFFLYIFIGVMLHIFLDMTSMTLSGQGFSCIMSQIYNVHYNKNRKDLID